MDTTYPHGPHSPRPHLAGILEELALPSTMVPHQEDMRVPPDNPLSTSKQLVKPVLVANSPNIIGPSEVRATSGATSVGHNWSERSACDQLSKLR